MKCNKIKISSVYLSVINSNIIYTKMSIDSCQTEGRQCIAFPQREKQSKERSTLRRAERSKIKGRIEDPREQKQMGFLHFWDSFGSISPRKLKHPCKRRYLRNS